MNPFRVKTRADLEAFLHSEGFTKTDSQTDTGEFWRSESGKHVQVPFEYQDDMYPDFYLKDLYYIIGFLKGS